MKHVCLVDVIKEGKNFMIKLPFDAKEIFGVAKHKLYIKATILHVEFETKISEVNPNFSMIKVEKKIEEKLNLDALDLKQEPMIIELKESIEAQDIMCNSQSKLDIFDVMNQSYNVKYYKQTQVKLIEIYTIINQGFNIISHQKTLPCEFIVITDQKKIQRIATKHPMTASIGHMPLLIFTLASKKHHATVSEASAYMATQNMILAAQALDLGATYVNLVDLEKTQMFLICDILNIPKYLEIKTLLIIGHKDENQIQYSKYQKNQLHFNVFKI